MGTKNLYENRPNPFFLFGTKNLVRVGNGFVSAWFRQKVWVRSDFSLTGPLFPIGIEHLIYMKFFCYGSSYGY